MRKNAVGFLALAAVLILLSGCSFNLFSSLDTIKIPSASDLLAKAAENAKGFVGEVQDYLDSGAITEDNAGDVVDALEDVYTNPEVDTETGQKAAVLAGEISITAQPATKEVVDNVVGTFVEVINGGGDVDPQTLITGIFSSVSTQEDLTKILDNLDDAAKAYNAFGSDTTGADSWMSGGEIGDVAQYAAVSMAISDIRTQVNDDGALFSVIKNGDPLAASDGTLENPFDSHVTTTYGTSIQNILNLASISLQEE